MRESVAVVVPHSRSTWPLRTRSSRVWTFGRNPLYGDRLDLELLLQLVTMRLRISTLYPAGWEPSS